LAGIALAKFRVALDALQERLWLAARSNPNLKFCAALLETYGVNDCMNQLLLEHLDARAWRASPEGKNKRGGCTVAGIFAHVHNIACPGSETQLPT
jgi:hypothetical protein